jgi:pentapeptide repeat protein
MANPDHSTPAPAQFSREDRQRRQRVTVNRLCRDVPAWNDWRKRKSDIIPDLFRVNLERANLKDANLSRANASGAIFQGANLVGANFVGANLVGANFVGANLNGADLSGACLGRAALIGADLSGADLSGADLSEAILSEATLSGANLRGADLEQANLVKADLADADLTGCRIYGISVWNVTLSGGTRQDDLIITAPNEPEVTVDNVEVAQFVYLLLHNEKIRDVIDTVGKKGVLLLGRFTEGRIAVLERLRAELRARGYLPIVFNFDKPETKDFTETVRLLAGLSHFVIADITNPKSAPLELQATVPEIMVPFLPIIEEGEKPFAMLADLWIKHRDWVFEPLYYSSLVALVGALDQEIIEPAETRFDELIVRKAERMKGRHV